MSDRSTISYDRGRGLHPPRNGGSEPEAPYVYQPYPKWVFHHREPMRLVETAEAHARLDGLWQESPDAATAAYQRLQDDLGTAAAERAYTDRRMTPAAQGEILALERDTDQHVLDPPAPPRRPRPRPKKGSSHD